MIETQLDKNVHLHWQGIIYGSVFENFRGRYVEDGPLEIGVFDDAG